MSNGTIDISTVNPDALATTSDVRALNDTIASLKEEMGGLKDEVGDLRDELKDLKTFLNTSSERLNITTIPGNGNGSGVGINALDEGSSHLPNISSTSLNNLYGNEKFDLKGLQGSKEFENAKRFRKSSQVFENVNNFASKHVSISSGYFSQSSEEDLTKLTNKQQSQAYCRDRRKSIEQDISYGVSAQNHGNIMEDMHRAIPFRVRRNSVISIKLDGENDDLAHPIKRRKLDLKELKEEEDEDEGQDKDKPSNSNGDTLSEITAKNTSLNTSTSMNMNMNKSITNTTTTPTTPTTPTTIIPTINSSPNPTNYAFFAVYDGHGGTQAADFLRQYLHSNIVNHSEFKMDPEKAIKEGFLLTEKQFIECVCSGNRSIHGVGTTAVIALIATSNTGTTLYIAHVGDSEAILCRKGKGIALTEPHNLKNPKEKERVEKCGGKMFQGRLGHPLWNPQIMSIAVTRAIGDLYFKLDEYVEGHPSGLIAEPDVLKIPLTTDDDFLLLASDGFWDVVSKDSAVEFIMSQPKHYDVNQICKGLTDYAMREKTLDDTTVLVVKLRP